MFVETLTAAAPKGSEFTITDRTLVQACVLGKDADGGNDSVITGTERVLIQVDSGIGAGDDRFRYYRKAIPFDDTKDFYLAAGTYRSILEGGKSETSIKLMLSPVTAD